MGYMLILLYSAFYNLTQQFQYEIVTFLLTKFNMHHKLRSLFRKLLSKQEPYI